MHLAFENGATLGMERDWFDLPGIAALTIEAMKRECPSATRRVRFCNPLR